MWSCIVITQKGSSFFTARCLEKSFTALSAPVVLTFDGLFSKKRYSSRISGRRRRCLLKCWAYSSCVVWKVLSPHAKSRMICLMSFRFVCAALNRLASSAVETLLLRAPSGSQLNVKRKGDVYIVKCDGCCSHRCSFPRRGPSTFVAHHCSVAIALTSF